jgi:hypothetical protein
MNILLYIIENTSSLKWNSEGKEGEDGSGQGGDIRQQIRLRYNGTTYYLLPLTMRPENYEIGFLQYGNLVQHTK